MDPLELSASSQDIDFTQKASRMMTFNSMVEDIKNKIKRPLHEDLDWDDSIIGKLNISNESSEHIFIEKPSWNGTLASWHNSNKNFHQSFER